MTRRLGFGVILVALAASVAMADAGDPPSRVGRLNYLSGPVSFRPGSVDDWVPATLNYPLTNGDHLWTDEGAQTEIHIGSTAVRMGAQTAISILNLDDRIAQISLTQGVLNVHIRYLGENQSVEVDTPNVAVSLLRSGDYRINADGDNAVTMVNVRGGEAEVMAGSKAFPVRSGQSAQLTGMDTPTQDLGPAPPPDAFDGWCQSREQRDVRPSRRATCRARRWAMKTWMHMVCGRKSRHTEWYGGRAWWRPAGRRITMATGPGWSRGAGRGLTMRHGDSLLSTTAVGPLQAEAGCGFRDGWRWARWGARPVTRPRW